MKTLVLHYSSITNENLSYQNGWVKALKKDKKFECTFINLNDFAINKQEIYSLKILNYYKNLNYIQKLILTSFDVIIILHSAFSNACYVPRFMQKIISSKNSYKIYLIGNEYKLMPEKIKFTKNLKINLFITQSLSKDIIKKYKEELKCEVMGIPGGALDEEVFYPKKNFNERLIDVGYRTFDEPKYFGHQERYKLMIESKKVLDQTNTIYDFSMNEKDRFTNENWSNFINNCKSFIGTNTGFDYFELNDEIRNKVNNFENSLSKLSPEKKFERIYKVFFKDRKRTNSMRLITGKNIEAAGCKTLQFLVEGDYGGYFEPDIHYIKINKDLNNLEECFEKLSDKNLCEKIINSAYNITIENLKYNHHLEKLYNFITK